MSKEQFAVIFLFILFISIFVSVILARNTENKKAEKKEITAVNEEINRNLRPSLLLSQGWFDNFQNDQNILNYIYIVNEGFTEERNMVREVGSFWGYVRLYGFNQSDVSRENIEKIRRNIQNYIKYDHIEGRDIAYIEQGGIAQVNTQAFYILALAELSKNGIELTQREKGDLKKILEGIYLMRAEQGGLWYIYYLPKEHNKISPYGTSETLFALVSYYKYIDNDEKVLSFAKEVFDEYYETAQKNDFSAEPVRAFYSWILYFLVELVELENSYSDEIGQLVSKALDYRKDIPICKERGCLISPTNVSEAAFLEGGLYAYKHLNSNGYVRIAELREYIDLAIEDVLSLQIKSKEDYENKTGQEFKQDPNFVIGGFCGSRNQESFSCDSLRVDFTQHASSALLNYLNIFVYE